MAEDPDIEEAFVQLVVSHQAALHAFVSALMPGSPDVDDVVQEANTEIWRKRGEFEIGTNFKAWMFSVAEFKVKAVWRDQKRRKVWAVPEETLEKLLNDAAQECFPVTDARCDAMRECIQQLRPEDRGIVLRYYYKGLNLGELATELGRNADFLKGRLHRIRKSLRRCIQHKTGVRRAIT